MLLKTRASKVEEAGAAVLKQDESAREQGVMSISPGAALSQPALTNSNPPGQRTDCSKHLRETHRTGFEAHKLQSKARSFQSDKHRP